MDELDGQALLVILLLGEDAMEVNDWEVMALHEEQLPTLNKRDTPPRHG